MNDATPEAVLHTAFKAVANGNAAALAAVAADRQLIVDAELRGMHLEPARIVEFIAEHLARVPATPRKRLGCRPIGHVRETDSIAHVLFRVHWQGEPEPRRTIHVATFHGGPHRWRLVLHPLSDWLVPGFENVLVAESFGD